MFFWILSHQQEIETQGHQDAEVCWRKHYKNNKLHEVFIVSLPYTIVYPGTMVVHFIYTNSTFRAMVCSLRFPCHVTTLTCVQSCCVNVIGNFNFFWNQSRICKTCPQVTNQCKKDEAIEQDKVNAAIPC